MVAAELGITPGGVYMAKIQAFRRLRKSERLISEKRL